MTQRKAFHDATSNAMRRVFYTVVATCLFCVVTLAGTPDAELLTPEATVTLPGLNYPISFMAFLIVSPVILIGLTIYLHILVAQHRRLEIPREEKQPILPSFGKWTPRLAVLVIFYWMVPITFAVFAWKAWPRPGGPILGYIAFGLAAILVLLQMRRCPEEWRAWALPLLVIAYALFYVGVNAATTDRQLDLYKADLSKKDLRNTNLSGALLREAKLSGADLSGADLRSADLRSADLSGANLSGASLREADLRGARLRQADLGRAHLRWAKLNEADLSLADLSEAHLSRADLSGAHLRDAHLGRAHLRWAKLNGADLSLADLRGADLNGASLHEANLRSADLSRADLSGARLREAHLDRAHLRWTKLSGADLSLADLSRTDLSGALLREANLRSADLSGANLSGAKVDQLQLDGACVIEDIPTLTPPLVWKPRLCPD